MSQPFLAEIRLFGGNFPPRGWAVCDGQVLPIAQNQSLFALLGTQYGGDGRTTFALPDLRGLSPRHPASGQGAGVVEGSADCSAGTVAPLAAVSVDRGLSVTPSSVQAMTATANTAVSNRPPYLALNYIIALQGLFPSRS